MSEDQPPVTQGEADPPSAPLSAPPQVLGPLGLTQVHPDHKKVLRIKALIASMVMLVPVTIIQFAAPVPMGVLIVPALILAGLFIWRLPRRRYDYKGFDMGADRLRVVRGYWWRADAVVPFGRVQHLDVQQGPLERTYGLATLILHTAGTHNASVPLAGLLREDAEAMRETIRQHIKREAL
ncbi:PH domain-containing protein [Altererythrobacter aquiaggeris]|uniref:PH domain-containing protein n=1 Tax=Aestuarierythrobacter aquiaggeris TaxID=1898396 RepID=UPI00301B3D94